MCLVTSLLTVTHRPTRAQTTGLLAAERHSSLLRGSSSSTALGAWWSCWRMTQGQTRSAGTRRTKTQASHLEALRPPSHSQLRVSLRNRPSSRERPEPGALHPPALHRACPGAPRGQAGVEKALRKHWPGGQGAGKMWAARTPPHRGEGRLPPSPQAQRQGGWLWGGLGPGCSRRSPVRPGRTPAGDARALPTRQPPAYLGDAGSCRRGWLHRHRGLATRAPTSGHLAGPCLSH